MSVARGFPNAGHFYSNIVKPIKIDCNFIVDPANGNGLGIRSLKSNGFIRNVFMHTSATPGTNDNYTNPNPASGYALIQMKQNFNYYLGGFNGFVSPTTGSTIAISGSGLTAHNPYIIASVGAVPAAKFTITTVADVSGSLASTYFTIADVYSNNYVVWFSVSGVGAAPSLTGPLQNYIPVQQSITTGATAATIATALGVTLSALNSTTSFSASATGAVLTVTSAATNTNLQFSNLPLAQTSGFTMSSITFTSLAKDWQHVGLQQGLTPTVGQSFIATTTGGALGSGTVIAPGVSGISSVEVIGDPNQSINNSNIASFGGAWLLVQFLNGSAAVTAPATNSVCGMSFFFDGSEVTVDGL